MLLVLEVKVAGFGLLAVGGIVSLVLGSMMLVDSPLPELQVGLSVDRAGGVRGVGDHPRAGPAGRARPAASGRHGQRRDGRRAWPGALGRSPRQGSVASSAHGETWNARSSDAIVTGEGIEVVAVDGLVLHVRRQAHGGVAGDEMTIITPPLIVLFLLVLYLISSIKILNEYERGVIFRLGKLLPEPKGPGLVFVFAPIDRMVRVSLRTVVLDVPPQDVITRDNVSVKVNAVVYFRVMDPRRAIVEVENYNYATSQLSQTTLRSVLGQVELDDLLSSRERLNQQLQTILDQRTDPWGIKVSAVEVKHVDLPPDMQRAMARQAEAEREKRAKIIHAEGELMASEKLSQAAQVIGGQPQAITLRYLQTLTEIASEKNSTIIFPLPIDLISMITGRKDPTTA